MVDLFPGNGSSSSGVCGNRRRGVCALRAGRARQPAGGAKRKVSVDRCRRSPEWQRGRERRLPPGWCLAPRPGLGRDERASPHGPSGHQVHFNMSYSGHTPNVTWQWVKKHNACKPYTNPQQVAWGVANPGGRWECDVTKGGATSYWALQVWQRELPDGGQPANATQRSTSCRYRTGRATLPVLWLKWDWIYSPALRSPVWSNDLRWARRVRVRLDRRRESRPTASAATSTSTPRAHHGARATGRLATGTAGMDS